jgi:hypothetical protein
LQEHNNIGVVVGQLNYNVTDDCGDVFEYYRDRYPSNTILGFNFIQHLTRHHFIGQVYPVSYRQQHLPKMFTTFDSERDIIDECKRWSDQDITLKVLRKHLEDNGIELHVFTKIDQFVTAKKEYHRKYGHLMKKTPLA